MALWLNDCQAWKPHGHTQVAANAIISLSLRLLQLAMQVWIASPYRFPNECHLMGLTPACWHPCPIVLPLWT